MNKKIFFKNIISIFMVCVFFLTNVFCLEAEAEEELKEASGCTFVINSEFVPAGSGLFVNRNRPMESSSISYSIYSDGSDLMLTNREKGENEGKTHDGTMETMAKLDKKSYEKMIASAYNGEYGEDVGFNVSSFENITIDGYPGYKIVASYQPSNSQCIYQTVFIIRSKHRIFTVTYQRAEDDECEESFEISAGTIRVK
ncbi:MAG: hypothetical protein J5802_12260 [Butyrivibrio sp.]|nr:hypothetical protein [Butyrivibrio sp.]